MPHIGHPAIRNRGTIGGSIAFADPAAELPACLLALGGEVDDRRPAGQAHASRPTISSRACSRPRSRRDEVLTAIRIPAATAGTPHAALRSSRAATATTRWRALPPARACRRQAPGRCPARVFRRRRDAGAGAQCRGRARQAAMSMRRSPRSRSDLDPPDDVQATGAVKRHLAGVLLRRVARAADGGAAHERRASTTSPSR